MKKGRRRKREEEEKMKRSMGRKKKKKYLSGTAVVTEVSVKVLPSIFVA